MTPDQNDHMQQIIDQVVQAISTKYPRGAKEHNSKLWEYGALALLDASIEEKIDDITYSITLRDKLIELIEQIQNLKDENAYLAMKVATEVDR